MQSEHEPTTAELPPTPVLLVRQRQGVYLPQLDGLRAAAVIGVAIFHARSQLVPGGFIGVDVFFVLSGYLITGISLSELRKTNRLSLTRFYLRRALRLFPALFFCALLLSIVYLFVPNLPEGPETQVGILGAITYSSTWLVAFNLADLGAMLPTWSLAVEEHFYLIWPVLLLIAYRAGRWLRSCVLAFAVAGIVYRWAAYYSFGWDILRIHYAPDTRAEQLLIGCALAVLLPGFRRRVPAAWAWSAAALLLIFALVSDKVPVDIYHRGGSTGIALLAAVLVAHLVTGRGAMSRLLSSRPLVWIGKRSYGIYLWNLPIIAILGYLGEGIFPMAVKVMASFLIPALSYAFIEQPFLRLKNRFEPAARAGTTSKSSRLQSRDG